MDGSFTKIVGVGDIEKLVRGTSGLVEKVAAIKTASVDLARQVAAVKAALERTAGTLATVAALEKRVATLEERTQRRPSAPVVHQMTTAEARELVEKFVG